MTITTNPSPFKPAVVVSSDFQANTLYRSLANGTLYWCVVRDRIVKLCATPRLYTPEGIDGRFERVEKDFEVTLKQE